MATERQSFISNLIGENTYESCIEYAKPIVIIGSCILFALYVLSYFFHLDIISNLINLTNGVSLFCIGFIAEVILLLDRKVDVEEAEYDSWNVETDY